VRRDDGVGAAQGVAAVARPRVVSRRVHHMRPHRIELDVALAGEEVAVGLDDRRAEAALEECPAASVGAVDVLYVALAETLHEQRRSALALGRHQKMHMVGHEHVRVDPHRLARGKSGQGIEKCQAVGIGEEDRRPVATAQDRVHRKAGGDDARVSWHVVRSPGRNRCGHYSKKPWSVPARFFAIARNRGLSPVFCAVFCRFFVVGPRFFGFLSVPGFSVFAGNCGLSPVFPFFPVFPGFSRFLVLPETVVCPRFLPPRFLPLFGPRFLVWWSVPGFSVPEGSRAPIAVVDVLYVTAPHADNDPRNRSGACGRNQQMDVVGHQHVGVQRATLARQRLAEPLQVGMVVLFVEEARLTIMNYGDSLLNALKADAR